MTPRRTEPSHSIINYSVHVLISVLIPVLPHLIFFFLTHGFSSSPLHTRHFRLGLRILCHYHFGFFIHPLPSFWAYAPFSLGLCTLNYIRVYTPFICLGLRTHLFISWVYAPVFSLGLRTRWVYTPIYVFLGFTHPFFLWVYAPAGFTHPFMYFLGLRTRFFFGFTHPLGLHTHLFTSWVYAPAGFTHPFIYLFLGFTHPLFFVWVDTPLFSLTDLLP
jgi:hypothetical protein